MPNLCMFCGKRIQRNSSDQECCVNCEYASTKEPAPTPVEAHRGRKCREQGCGAPVDPTSYYKCRSHLLAGRNVDLDNSDEF